MRVLLRAGSLALVTSLIVAGQPQRRLQQQRRAKIAYINSAQLLRRPPAVPKRRPVRREVGVYRQQIQRMDDSLERS